MKAKIRKTGEIVDVISYNLQSSIRSSQDFVSYIDSNGVEHERESLNYYWDFEQINDVKNDIHWQNVREHAAIAAMEKTLDMLIIDKDYFTDIIAEGFRGDKKTYPNEIADFAVACADALVEQLKKEQK